MYAVRKRRVFRRRRRPFVKRRKFRRSLFKRRRGRTVTRRRRKRNYAVRSILCPVEIMEVPEVRHAHDHLVANTKWSLSDIPLNVRILLGYTYEQVKFLKVTFKYWLVDAYDEIQLTWGDTVQNIRRTGTEVQLRSRQ